jgi:hypothetical protein
MVSGSGRQALRTRGAGMFSPSTTFDGWKNASNESSSSEHSKADMRSLKTSTGSYFYLNFFINATLPDRKTPHFAPFHKSKGCDFCRLFKFQTKYIIEKARGKLEADSAFVVTGCLFSGRKTVFCR